MSLRMLLLGLLALVAAAASASLLAASAQSTPTPGPDAVHITILQLNDCYELLPAGGTDLGGVSRVATLRKQLLAKNPNTYTFLAGDLFSPSALGSTPIPFPSGPAFNGEQMVAGMNAIGVDLACLGNHETDVKVGPFTSNLQKSNFTWLSANARNTDFVNLAKNAIITTKPLSADSNRTVNIGVVGLTIDSNNKDYQSYHNFSYSSSTVAVEQIAQLNDRGADIVVALTHFDVAMDRVLTETVAGISIVVGGHEHSVYRIEDTPAPIYKADSNVRSVWVHDIWVDTTLNRTDAGYFIHKPELVFINASLASDPDADAVIQPYIDAAYASFNASGFDPVAPVALLTVDLDLRGSALGSGPLPASTWFAEAIYASATAQLNAVNQSADVGPRGVDISFFNVGTLRIDDVLPRGTILSEYDVLRIAPFVNLVQVARISGSLLRQVLLIARANQFGAGGNTYSSQFLAYTNLTYTSAAGADNQTAYSFFVNGAALDDSKSYSLAITDYLAGGPAPYGLLATAAPADFSIIFSAKNRSASDPVRIMSDPRSFFIGNLRALFPPSGVAPLPPPAVFVSFVLGLPLATVDTTAFRAQLAAAIADAVGVSLARVDIVAVLIDHSGGGTPALQEAAVARLRRVVAAASGRRPVTAAAAAAAVAEEEVRTQVIFSIAAAGPSEPGATVPFQAASSFIAQAQDATSRLRTGSTAFATIVPASAATVPDPSGGGASSSSTGGSDLGAAVSAPVASLAHVALLAVAAVAAALRAL